MIHEGKQIGYKGCEHDQGNDRPTRKEVEDKVTVLGWVESLLYFFSKELHEGEFPYI